MKDQPSKKARHSLRILSVQRVETKLMLAPRIGIESTTMCALFFNRLHIRVAHVIFIFFFLFCFVFVFFFLFFFLSPPPFLFRQSLFSSPVLFVSFQHWLCFFFPGFIQAEPLSETRFSNTLSYLLGRCLFLVSISNMCSPLLEKNLYRFSKLEKVVYEFLFLIFQHLK